MIPSWLLAILRCPITEEPLAPASDELVSKLQSAANKGDLRSKLGVTISETWTQGLVNESGTWFYPVDGETIDLLQDNAISIASYQAS
jgi:uncharacterized protein YbaR (Trm112 family)